MVICCTTAINDAKLVHHIFFLDSIFKYSLSHRTSTDVSKTAKQYIYRFSIHPRFVVKFRYASRVLMG